MQASAPAVATAETFPAHLRPLLDQIVIRERPYLDHGNGLLSPLVDSQHIPNLDPDYLPRSELDRVILDCIATNRRLLLTGDAGSGKSSALVQAAARLGWPCRRVNLNGETGVSEFVGQYVVRSGEMLYQYGVLPQAMREGQILILDEIDAAQPEVLFVLQAVLEGEPLLLTDTGETIPPHSDFRLFATANSIGDESGLYSGTRTQNAATIDRWDVVLRVGYPDPIIEADLVQKKTGSTIASTLVRIFTDLRDAVTRGDLSGPFSTRRLIAFANMLQRYDGPTALKLSVTDRLVPDERKIVEEMVQRHLGGQSNA